MKLETRLDKIPSQANLKHCKYYNNRLNFIHYERGDQVYYLHSDNSASKEHNFKWKGPYTVVNQLSDCIYRIQQGYGKPCLVVHHNKLKKAYCREPVDISWLHKIPEPVLVENSEVDHEAPKPSTSTRPCDRPRRLHKSPERLGNWHYDLY